MLPTFMAMLRVTTTALGMHILVPKLFGRNLLEYNVRNLPRLVVQNHTRSLRLYGRLYGRNRKEALNNPRRWRSVHISVRCRR